MIRCRPTPRLLGVFLLLDVLPLEIVLRAAYWTMLTSVPNISSAVVIVRELAW
jgi:hypothetical protein